MSRTRIAIAVAAAALFALPSIATATPANDDGTHQVTICHVTESEGNPYVMITVDVAAFDGEGANDHSHHVAKDGRMDKVHVEGTDCGDEEPPNQG